VQSLAAECGVSRSVEVLLHEEVAAPLTYGVWRPAILLPYDAREWSEEDLRRALIHELEHVRRGDWTVQVSARVVCALYWFHPLVWVAWRRLRLEAERASDDAVLQSAERTEYADQLVSLARRLSRTHGQATIGMANRSDLSARVSTLLDAGQQRGRAGLLAAASAFCVASLVVLTIAPIRTIAQLAKSPAPEPDSVVESSGTGQTVQAKRRSRSGTLDERLFKAAERGDSAGVDELLRLGADVNSGQEGDGTPLITAALNGHLAVVKQLLDRGADPNTPMPGDGNPLIMAAREGHIDIVRLLLDRGADPNVGVPGDGNALIMSASEGHAEIVALLLDRGASIDLVVPGDENALIQASGEGHIQVVKLLISRGADVNARVWVGNDIETIEGSQVRRTRGEWRTPLSMARKGRHAVVAALLIEAGAVD
jgi:ankyrin repeat protein